MGGWWGIKGGNVGSTEREERETEREKGIMKKKEKERKRERTVLLLGSVPWWQVSVAVVTSIE